MAGESIAGERLMASLSGFFGAIAIVLAAVGVYGVVSYTAATRQREIGIRLALGAAGVHIVRTVLGRVTVVMGAGLVAGFGIALWADAAATSLLYGIEPGDPAVIAGIVGVIAAAGLLAAILPARRALRTDPVVALRTE